VPQDYKKAVKWYRMSSDQGQAQAQTNLGLMYANGTGVPQDYKEAFAWFSLAKAIGNEIAKDNLDIVAKKMTREQISDAMSLPTKTHNRGK